MYQDYWIKTTDETTWLVQAQAAGVLIKSVDFEGKEILVSAPDYAIDVVGTIYTAGEYNVNPDMTINVLVAPVALPGWHVNIRASKTLNTDILSVISKPSNPHRVWF
jgi:hypothetical protein